MGFTFSLVLSREVTEDESAILQDAGCSAAVFTTDSLPTNAEVTVTKMDFDDTVSPSLAEAIESALETVKKVPDLSVPGLIVPAQPAERPAEDSPVAEAVTTEEATGEANVTNGKPKKASARKSSAKKAVAATLDGHEEKVEVAVEVG